MRGRKPKPEAVKAQRAPVRSKRQPKAQADSATVEIGGLRAPDWLEAEALAEWMRLAPTLQGAKLLTATDATAFARYCRNLARWLKMQKALDADGEIYTVTTQSGTVHRPRPEFMIADRLERQLLAAEDRFGLNPAERQRIMAARAQTGVSGDLFDQPQAAKREGDPATPAARPAQPLGSPIGMLN